MRELYDLNSGPAVAVDFETYYDDIVSIRTMGAWAYLHHPKVDVYLVTVYDGEQTYTGRPEDFDWPSLKGRLIVSWNASFDKMVHDVLVEKGLIEHAQFAEWNCVANLAVYLRAGRSLKAGIKDLYDAAVSKDYRAKALGRTEQEMKDAGVWDQIVESNVGDTIWTWKAWTDNAHQWPELERRLSVATYEQCQLGLPLDLPMVKAGIKAMEKHMKAAAAKVPWECTWESGVTSIKALHAKCDEVGVIRPPSTSEDDPNYLAWEEEYGDQYPWVNHMREWRKCNTVYKRLLIMRDRITPQGRFPYPMKYGGAHTLRWSGGQGKGGTGETGFNPQNLGKEPVHGVDVRRCIVASKGRHLIISDAAQIEPRSMAWLSGDEEKLELMRQGITPYEAHARTTMGWDKPEELKKGDKRLYQLAKIRVLGLGYGCGWMKYMVFAKTQYQYIMTAAESKAQVIDFRKKETKITGLWNRLQSEFIESVDNPEWVTLPDGRTVPAYIMELPSGRPMTYYYPQIARRSDVYGKKTKGGKTKKAASTPNNRLSLEEVSDAGSYRMEYAAKKQLSGGLSFFYGGLLAENLTQACARDAFGVMMLNVQREFGRHLSIVTKRGKQKPCGDILFTSHDELIMDADKGISPKEVEEVMAVPPSWMADCPFGAEAIASDFYMK
jgi:hypothetical protein